ncbi:MAG: sulfatase-like hydrolase/transferase [Butyribacter sp.]|nr:sulfatase-like hydrolase/transferase [Butyribacter sp.]
MIQKYFRFTKKRIATFLFLALLIITAQVILTGSMISRQKVTTEAGNSESAVIGILDKTEIVRQKFEFDRKVILKEFSLSFGSFERDEVGDQLNIQMLDGDNNIVYESTVPVDDITPNASYRVEMDHTVTIPKGVTCCIKISCSSKKSQYDTIPTLNTTNRTNPNTYMSTLKMQTRKKSLNISYTYYYRQIFPLVMIILEFAALFILCFERVTEYGVMLRKKQQKKLRQLKRLQERDKEAQEKRKHSKDTSAKVRYSRANTEQKKATDKKRKAKQKQSQKKNKSFKDFVKWCLVEPKVLKRVRIAAVIFNPLLTMFAIELINENLLGMGPNVWIFTWILLLAVEILFYAVSGNMFVSMIVLDCILFIAGLANLILMNVRGTPFLPGDLLALGTATEVANTYKISLTPAQFVMLPAFVIWCLLLSRLKEKKKKTTPVSQRVIRRVIPLAASCLVIGVLYNTPVLENVKITDNVWNKVASSRTNGFYMNFFLNIHYLSVSKPDGYSQEEVTDILDAFQKEKNDTATKQKRKDENGNEVTSNSDYGTNKTLQGKKPNIILIMNESLADYDMIGKTNYNRDPLEFMHSLKDNTIYGKDYVSIYGAGTSNSEFEAMTGNTMSFFPSGCNVYQQFMHKSTFSMPYYLKSLGYDTVAVHPSSGANWNRINTYNSMRFDRFVTIDDFKNPEYVRYISDKESYKKVIELYEQKDKDTPLFCFNMTIQNHGGYLTNTNWENPVYMKGSYYQEAKEFLSATKVSDDAFKYLIDYFKNADEPTIICMFGDHQPSIEVEFYEEIMKKRQDDWSFEDLQKRFVTPFIVWANYDIEEGQNVVLSNNYLENLVLKQAGLELPVYNQYIEKVSETIPVMNVNGYMDNAGKWHKYDTDETETIQKLLYQYELLQYAYYSDSDKATMKKLFQIKD